MNAAHTQLKKKLQMEELLTISTFSEMRLFLKNHSAEFHKIWQEDTSGSV